MGSRVCRATSGASRSLHTPGLTVEELLHQAFPCGSGQNWGGSAPSLGGPGERAVRQKTKPGSVIEEEIILHLEGQEF